MLAMFFVVLLTVSGADPGRPLWADSALAPPFDSYIMQIQPILGLYQPILTLSPLFLQILDPALCFLEQVFQKTWVLSIKGRQHNGT